MKLIFIFAMESEAESFLQNIGAVYYGKLDPKLPQIYYEADYAGHDIMVIVNGKDDNFNVDSVGTQPATLSAYLAMKFSPDIVINAGTAGGWEVAGTKIGDVFLSSGTVKYHDRIIPIPGYDEYGIGSYPVYDAHYLVRDIPYLKLGIVSTGNSLVASDNDTEQMSSNRATVKEMEAAAIAYVCELYNVEFMAVKAITDLLEVESTQEQFLNNLQLASHNLHMALLDILDYIERP